MAIIFSCGQQPYQKKVDKIFKGPLFRNQHLGNSYSSVMKSEEEKLMLFPDSNMIKYHYMVTDTEDYYWAYVFKNDKVSQIHFEAFLGTVNNGKTYMGSIKNKYDKILGPAVEIQHGFQWKSDTLSVIVFDESRDANMGYVRMVFHRPSDSSLVIPQTTQ